MLFRVKAEPAESWNIDGEIHVHVYDIFGDKTTGFNLSKMEEISMIVNGPWHPHLT